MTLPGIRNTRVSLFALNSQEYYERLRPQGGRCVSTGESVGGRSSRASREGNSRHGAISQRRGRARSAYPFDTSITCCFRETDPTGRLPGTSQQKHHIIAHNRFAFLIPTILSLLVFTACGRHKQARVNVPPPPPVTDTTSQTKI